MEQIVKQRLNFAIEEIIKEFKQYIEIKIKYCKIQSPIEQLFFIEWQKQNLLEDMLKNSDGNLQECCYQLRPQEEEVIVGKIKYRIDFAVFERDVYECVEEVLSYLATEIEGKELDITYEKCLHEKYLEENKDATPQNNRPLNVVR